MSNTTDWLCPPAAKHLRPVVFQCDSLNLNVQILNLSCVNLLSVFSVYSMFLCRLLCHQRDSIKMSQQSRNTPFHSFFGLIEWFIPSLVRAEVTQPFADWLKHNSLTSLDWIQHSAHTFILPSLPLRIFPRHSSRATSSLQSHSNIVRKLFWYRCFHWYCCFFTVHKSH